jgi:hypothetical protein
MDGISDITVPSGVTYLHLSCTADHQKFRPHPTTLENLSLKNTQVEYEAIPKPVYHRVRATANRLIGTMSMAFSD